jgi:hypothetical protein
MPGLAPVRRHGLPPANLSTVLPYASYLRVYEPARALSQEFRSDLRASRATLTESLATVATEQQTSLRRTVTPSALLGGDDGSVDVYVLRREGRLHLCPVDLALRSWLSLTAFIGDRTDPSLRLLMPPDSLGIADERFLQWRRDHPRTVPHIQQAAWEVPRAWFTLIVDDERETYDAGGFTGVRYRARMADARRRITTAARTLRDLVDDLELIDSLSALAAWLETFDDASWVEVDYAGVAKLLGPALRDDRSAREVWRALRALRAGDLAAAASAYRSFTERWRAVSAYERAN